jgi:hypothetical protein
MLNTSRLMPVCYQNCIEDKLPHFKISFKTSSIASYKNGIPSQGFGEFRKHLFIVLIFLSIGIYLNGQEKVDKDSTMHRLIRQSVEHVIDVMDFSEGNTPSPSMFPFNIDPTAYLSSFSKNDAIAQKVRILNIFNPSIRNELKEYARIWTPVCNDTIIISKMRHLASIIESVGMMSVGEYWKYGELKNNINSVYASKANLLIKNYAFDITKPRRIDHQTNQFECIVTALVYRFGSFYTNDSGIELGELIIPLDFKVLLAIDDNGNLLNIEIVEISLSGYKSNSRYFRINGNIQGGYAFSDILLDREGIARSYVGPGKGSRVDLVFGFDMVLPKFPRLVPGFEIGIGYQSTTFDYFLNNSRQIRDMTEDPPENLINLIKYSLITDFNNVVQQTSLTSFTIPVGIKLTYYTDPKRTIGIRVGVGMASNFHGKMNTISKSGQLTYSASCTFIDNQGNYSDFILEEDLLGYKEYPSILASKGDSNLSGSLTGYYTLGFEYKPETSNRFGGFIQFSNSFPINNFNIKNSIPKYLGTGMNGQTENLLYFSNSLGLRSSIIQAGFFINILREIIR